MAETMGKYRWDPCIVNRGDEVNGFIDQYLGKPDRKILFVAGAGFDPRACMVAARLRDTNSTVQALLVREKRPDPSQELLKLAMENEADFLTLLTNTDVQSINVFQPDGASVAGRNVVNTLRQRNLEYTTDVVVDISALSVGTYFPIIRYFVENIFYGKSTVNLHLFVAHDPCLDAQIRARASDTPGYVHGFKGGATLYDEADAARLWLPLLASGRLGALATIYDFVDPHDTCPILPFPAFNPRLGDEHAEEYLVEFESSWEVDARNVVYADEGDPLDLYRTILRLNDLRRSVFEAIGGSMLVLSPLGGKVMALGTLLAALERDLPVVHLESMGYELDYPLREKTDSPMLIHVWLEGEIYPEPRPSLYNGWIPSG